MARTDAPLRRPASNAIVRTTGTTSAPVTVATPGGAAPATAGTTVTASGDGEAPADASAPPPAVDVGVVGVWNTPEGVAYVSQRIDCMPLEVDLEELGRFGIDPLPIIEPLPLLPSLFEVLPDPVGATLLEERC